MDKFIPREWQDSLITTVSKNLEEKNTIALEAPTGSGKTSFILYLSFLTDKKIIYLTRTHNEFTRIYEDNKKYFNLPIIYLFGKSNLCPLKERWYDTDENQKNVCKGCVLKDKIVDMDLLKMRSPEEFINDVIDDSIEKIRDDLNKNNMGRDQKGNLTTLRKDKMRAYCPYYSVRENMKDAKIIMMTYNYLLNPSIRYNVFYNNDEEKIDLNDYYIIFDEAHNLDSVIENFGRSLTNKSILKSIDLLVDEFPLNKYKCHERVEANLILEELLNNFSSTRETDNLKNFKFSNDFLFRMKDLESLKKFSDEFDKMNDERPLKDRSKNYIETVYNFLYDYQRMENGGLYSSINFNGKELRLRIMYYDTSEYFSFLKNRPAVFMSGTLPSEDHISKVWNMDNVFYIRVNDIFKNTGGIKKYRIVNGYTTLGKYRNNIEEWSEMLKKYMDFIVNTYNESEKSVIVAVPSYKIMFGDNEKKIPGIGTYLPDDMRKNVFFENKRISFNYLEKTALASRIIIFSVHGGKLLEGIQLIKDSKSLISDVIIAGLPLIPLDDYRKNKINYLEKALGRNSYNILYYEYALIKIKQAAGRSTRSPEDRANIWLCDDRFDSYYWKKNLLNE